MKYTIRRVCPFVRHRLVTQSGQDEHPLSLLKNKQKLSRCLRVIKDLCPVFIVPPCLDYDSLTY